MKYSIIIPTYNNAALLKDCVESIITYTSLNDVEIIVVANGCKDETESYLQIKMGMGQVSPIWEAEAIGYPKAVNMGIKEARGEFIVLLNDDTKLLPQPQNQWLEMLHEPFKNRHDKVGISGPQMMTKPESLNHDFMCFFCAMLRREMIEEIGMLDEIFSPGYSEDIDYSFRAESKGWKIVQVPSNDRPFYDHLRRTGNFQIYHVGTQTFSRQENQDEELIKRNNQLIIDRWKPYFDGFKDFVEPERKTGKIPEENKIISIVGKKYKTIYRDNDDIPPLLFKSPTVKEKTPYGIPFVEVKDLEGAFMVPKKDPYGFTITEDVKYDTSIIEGEIKNSGFTWEEDAKPTFVADGKIIPMIDISRAHKIDGFMADTELEHLAKLASQTKSVFIEVGSWHGKSTAAIVDHLPPGAVLYCIDTWNGSINEQDTNHASAKQDDGDHAFVEFLNNHFENIQKGKIIPLRMTSKNASWLLGDWNIDADVIFIDAQHTYEAVTDDIKSWEFCLANNGIMCGHDYGTQYWPDVTNAVNNIYRQAVKHIENTSIWEVEYKNRWAVEKTIIPEQKKEIRTTPCVFDCFPFNNELDILEMRLTELDPVVDRFVIVEARQTHSGMPKPLYFSENYMRFEKFLNKITVLVIEEFPDVDPNNPHWSRERYQRDFALKGLTECIPEDIIISCDCDEIPTSEIVEQYKKLLKAIKEPYIASIQMDLYYYNIHTLAEIKWSEGKILEYQNLSKIQSSLTQARYCQSYHPIVNNGFHLSYFGSAKDIVRKIEATAHQEYNQPMFKNIGTIQERMNEGKDIFGRPEIKFMSTVLGFKKMPKWFEENKDNEKIKKYL